MGRKRDKSLPKERMSPTHTVANLTDDFMKDLNLPQLPEKIPARLEEALRKRVNSLLYQMRVATQERYVGAIELRIVRDAHRAVLTSYELGIHDSENYYATFRRLAEALGYERCEIGYRKQLWG